MTKSRLAISLFFFLHGLCFASWGGRIPDISVRHGLSEGELGTLLLTLPIGSILSMPLATFFVSHFGSKKVLSFAIPAFSSILVLVGLSPSIKLLGVALVLFGLISNHVNVSLNTQAIRLEAQYKKSIMASLHGLWSLAGFMGAGVGFLMIKYEFLPFEHFLLVAFFSYVITAFMSRNLLSEEKGTPSIQRFTWKMPSRSILVLGLIAFASMLCEGAMFDWAGVYFKNVLNIDGPMVTAGYVAFMFTMAGTRFIADYFKEKFGFKNILIVSGILVGSGLLIAVGFNTMLSCIFGFLLVGSGVSSVVPLVFSESGRVSPCNPSGAVAIISTIGFLGFLIGPPLIGWIAAFSSLRVSFVFVSIVGFIMAASYRLVLVKKAS